MKFIIIVGLIAVAYGHPSPGGLGLSAGLNIGGHLGLFRPKPVVHHVPYPVYKEVIKEVPVVKTVVKEVPVYHQVHVPVYKEVQVPVVHKVPVVQKYEVPVYAHHQTHSYHPHPAAAPTIYL